MSTTNTIAAVTDLSEVVERYGIWERKPSGAVRPVQEDYTNPRIAQQCADEYNDDEKTMSEVEGSQPSTFFVAKQTTTFEEYQS